MTIADSLLPEFDREMGLTRRVLARVPDGQFAWKPHDKSMTLGRLAEHLAELPTWLTMSITESGIDLSTPRPADYRPPDTTAALLAMFDRNTAAARAAIAGRGDGEFMAPWTLRNEGKEVFTMPKIAVVRSFALNHLIHHRGQMTVYLRLQNVSLPSIYGPSADEQTL
jgi:uncharacterized damage-inducible protein DinB